MIKLVVPESVDISDRLMMCAQKMEAKKAI